MSVGIPSDDHDQLTLDILSTLEEAGVDPTSYRLYDFFDPDALERLVTSLDSEFSVTLSVQGVEILVTDGGVRLAENE